MAITRIGGANAITGTIPTSVGGTGSTAATLPASLINNTSIGNVTALPAAISTGKVLQVQSSSITSTANSSTTSIVEFMNLSITPSSTSNKIFCLYQGTGYANGHNNSLLVRLFRGTISGTQLAQTAIADGNNDYEGYAFGLSKLDSPSTSSSQQYTIGFGATQALYHNMGILSCNHTLTLMEIAG